MLWQVVGSTLVANEPIIASIVNAVAIVVLVIVTWRYERHTKRLVDEAKLARRDDPELIAHLREPSDEDLRIRNITGIYGTFVTFTALLINPGLVPIAIENVAEEVRDHKGNKLASAIAKELRFALPKDVHAEQISLYVFGLPWVISGDAFAVWSRYLNVDKKDTQYLLTVKFDYSVGKKSKTMTLGPISLTSKEHNLMVELV